MTWTGKSVPAVTDGHGRGSITVHFTVRINNSIGSQPKLINDGYRGGDVRTGIQSTTG